MVVKNGVGRFSGGWYYLERIFHVRLYNRRVFIVEENVGNHFQLRLNFEEPNQHLPLQTALHIPQNCPLQLP